MCFVYSHIRTHKYTYIRYTYTHTYTVYPSQYQYWIPSLLKEWRAADFDQTWTINAQLNSNTQMVIFPDILLFYVCVEFTLIAAYLSRKSLWFRVEMRKATFFCCGFEFTTVWVCFFLFCPFFLNCFVGGEKQQNQHFFLQTKTKTKTTQQSDSNDNRKICVIGRGCICDGILVFLFFVGCRI